MDMPRLVTLEEYRTLERPSINWLIPGLLPKPGFVLLIGSPKAGKSSLALQIALAVAQGKIFLNKQVRNASVLYIQQDESELSWRVGKLDVLKTHGVSLAGPVHMVHPEDERRGLDILCSPDNIYLSMLIRESNAELVVIDVLRELFCGDENESGTMKAVFDRIAAATEGKAALLLHHIHKLDPRFPTPRPVDAARGSSYISGKVDAVWLLHDSTLRIQSRFGPDMTVTARRQPSGLFAF